MRILRARLTLPARMTPTAAADARQLAETVAKAISAQQAAAQRLSVEIPGHGRPVRHMAFDLTAATNRALRAGVRRT